MNRIRLGGMCATVAVLGAAVLPASAAAKPVITISGSTSVAPLGTLLARAYLKQYPGRVKFKLAQGGSDVGVADVAAGRVSIGMSSRDPKPSDPSGIFFNKIAKDAICIVTNTGNPIANLSQDQIKAIFSGKIRNWSDVAGAKSTGTINVITRTAASGTQDAFQKIFMGSSSILGAQSPQASNGLIQQTVSKDPQAIGYVSLDFVSGTSVSSYNGVACDLRNAKSGAYGGVRNFWLVTRGRPALGNPLQKFITWAQSSKRAQAVVGKHWVPLL